MAQPKIAQIAGSPGLPPLFMERLPTIIPGGLLEGVLASFSREKPVCVRINTIKTDRDTVCARLEQDGVRFEDIPGVPGALVLRGTTARDLSQSGLVKDGLIYIQGLSSMLPVLALDPQPGDRVLDMCAAPGSKTTQMAALMKNEGTITALEAVRPRFYKLKAVSALLGAGNIEFRVMDARRFRDSQGFDKILVDAPCSSEGRFCAGDPDSFGYWSARKIKEMVRKQRGIVLSASRLLKPGGVMVYSTCTFAPEENEGVVDWLLRKTEGRLALLDIDFEGTLTYPALTQWETRDFDPRVSRCRRVLPSENRDGFFIAKFQSL